MSAQVIPLTSSPNQIFQVTLNVNGSILKLSLSISYNQFGQYWIMQVSDTSGNILLVDVPLLTGVWPAANILKQYQYMQIGSAYVLNVSNGTTALDYPGASDLGTDFILVWDDNV